MGQSHSTEMLLFLMTLQLSYHGSWLQIPAQEQTASKEKWGRGVAQVRISYEDGRCHLNSCDSMHI